MAEGGFEWEDYLWSNEKILSIASEVYFLRSRFLIHPVSKLGLLSKFSFIWEVLRLSEILHYFKFPS